jgi:RNA polymerase sigma-70 factor (ECF subfamily)
VTKHRTIRDDAGVPVIGTAEPFERFYAREYQPVVALAYVLSGSRTGAEDLAQEGFLVAYREWDRVSTHPNPAAWVRRVVANRSVSLWRRRMAELKALGRLLGWTAASPEPMDPAAEELWGRVRRLPRRQAQAIALRYLEDLTVDQIAEILECSAGSVKQHLHRARATLASRLGEEGGEDDR